ncbi:MAG: carboxypeptidase-like regulatory domain-containing protein, partial [Fulvivirga sp.]|nr:carboxypeptidase-like regulatory domain-containing protein [Fulvivirga sp.]
MNFLQYYRILLLILLPVVMHAQEKVRLAGKVLDERQKPVVGTNITVKGTFKGTQSNTEGAYSLELTITNKVDTLVIEVSHIGYQKKTIFVSLKAGQEVYNKDITLKEDVAVLTEVGITGERAREQVSVITLKPKDIALLPTPFDDFNKVLSTLPGVVSNNELSSTYSVRGGNFDENLIYVNDIPIYRPFLISNGQQEGLSFVNTQMVEQVSFSAGGWQPVYGDKLSSVLNVTYKKPRRFGATASVSLLTGSVHAEGASKNDRISYLAGIRHKSSQYLLNTLETDGEYLPKFTDFQSYVNIKLGPDRRPEKTSLGILGAYARNRYLIEPENRETEFGTFTQALRLFVAFEGRELMEYDTYQGGIKLSHNFSNRWRSTLITSGVYAWEREYTEIEGGYRLCDVDKNIGSNTFNQCVSTRGIGTNYDFGRNTLNAEIIRAENRNSISLDNKQTLEFGFGISYQQFDDQLTEYSFVDSAGFVLEDEIISVQATNKISSSNITGYVQHTAAFSKKLTATYGVRVNHWDFNSQWLISPRVQVAYRPDWVRDVLFKGAIGVYQQPPLYRELRNFDGQINEKLEAQQSLHIIGGIDYNFRWWNRPFKFLGEVYYKKIYQVIPYDIDNVKIRYLAENNAEAYVAGIDMRLSGEFIEGTQSWFSLSVMNVRENVAGDGRGYIRRPTDQRVNLAIFFQDHLPNNPTFRANLNLLFGSGLPFGPPNNFNQRNIFNGESYRRVDVGLSKQIFIDQERFNKTRWIMI